MEPIHHEACLFHCDCYFFQDKSSSVGARLAEKRGGVAPWESPETGERRPSPRVAEFRQSSPESRARSWREQPETSKSSPDFKIVDNNEEYQPTYRKDFIRKDPSPPKKSKSVDKRDGGVQVLTPSSLVSDDRPKQEKPKSTVPQIDERSNRFGSLVRNFQNAGKSKDIGSPKDTVPVGKIKVASIFDRDDPLEEEEREKKKSLMMRTRARDPASSSLSAISSSSVRGVMDKSSRHEELRPHVLKKRQWEQQLKSEQIDATARDLEPVRPSFLKFVCSNLCWNSSRLDGCESWKSKPRVQCSKCARMCSCQADTTSICVRVLLWRKYRVLLRYLSTTGAEPFCIRVAAWEMVRVDMRSEQFSPVSFCLSGFVGNLCWSVMVCIWYDRSGREPCEAPKANRCYRAWSAAVSLSAVPINPHCGNALACAWAAEPRKQLFRLSSQRQRLRTEKQKSIIPFAKSPFFKQGNVNPKCTWKQKQSFPW